MMTFYRISDINKADQKSNNKSKKGILTFLIYVLVCLLFLITGFYSGRKFCAFRRKRLANELIDSDYSYETNNKDLKANKKLIEL